MAIVMLDHIGIVARNWQEARGVLVDQMGFTVDIERAPEPDGSYFAPEATHNYFVKVGLGQTRIEDLANRHLPALKPLDQFQIDTLANLPERPKPPQPEPADPIAALIGEADDIPTGSLNERGVR